MDLVKVLAELKRELANLDAAIQSLERLQTRDKKRNLTGKPDEGAVQPETARPEPELPPAAAAPKARGKGR